VASEAETLSLPAEPDQPATQILARSPVRRPGRGTARRLTARAALLAVAAAGVAVAIVLSNGGRAARPTTPHAVAPPSTGSNVAEQAQNLAAWLRQHSR
jgi:hypothetical protein